MKNIMTLLFRLVMDQYLATQMRSGAIKAVRGYIQAVKTIRQITLGVSGLSLVVSLFTAGVTLLLVGLISFIPMSAKSASWVLTIAGLIVALAGFLVLRAVFKEQRWLELSKSYDLMEAVVEPRAPVETLKELKTAFTGEPPTPERSRVPETEVLKPRVNLRTNPAGLYM